MKLSLLLCLLPFSIIAQKTEQNVGATKATAFVNSLDETQRKKCVYPFDEITRLEWHYTPTSMNGRTGISLKDLSEGSKQQVYDLLKTYLSADGYDKTRKIMDLEYVLKELEPNNTHRIPENYTISVYGEPSRDTIWAWKFTGHHIALNFTTVHGKLAFAPLFFGTNPGEIKNGPRKGERIQKAEEDVGFELLNALTPEQREQAIFQAKAYSDIVSTISQEVSPLNTVGIRGKDMTQGQKVILNKLISIYLMAMPQNIAEAQLKKVLADDINKISFGWAGATELGKPHYYRVQGKSFLIEFDNTQNNANHIHAVWRDFNGDYGRDLLKEHYQKAHHGAKPKHKHKHQ